MTGDDLSLLMVKIKTSKGTATEDKPKYQKGESPFGSIFKAEVTALRLPAQCSVA